VDHLHNRFVPGCYRCELNLDELEDHVYTRYATVQGNPKVIRRYLPDNYQLISYGHYQNLILGQDFHGWTLAYVKDRLASGLYFAKEIDPLEYLLSPIGW
jgi:hypothetical protein